MSKGILQNALKTCAIALIIALAGNQLFAQVANTIRPVAAKIVAAKSGQTVFEKVNLMSVVSDPLKEAELKEAVSKSLLVIPDQQKLSELVQSNKQAIEFSFPSPDGSEMTVEMVQVNLFTEDFEVVTDQSNGEALNYNRGVYYQGIVKGDNNSVAAFSFFNGEMMGVVSNNESGNIVVGKLKDNSNRYIIYSDRDIKADRQMDCFTYDDPAYATQLLQNIETGSYIRTTKCVRFYFEVDYDCYVANGSNLTNTTDWMTGMYNNIATIYTNESLGNGVSEIFIWTTTDPYNGTSSIAQLNLFKVYRATFDGDLATLIAQDPGGLGGVASTVNGLCTTNYKYCYSDVSTSYNTVPTYSWTIEVVTHELGHLLGSYHTHNCSWPAGALDNCGPSAGYPTEGGCSAGPAPTNGGTVMSYCHLTSYGINFNNGFGQYPGDAIRGAVDNATCLGTSCTGGGGTGQTCTTDNYEPNDKKNTPAAIIPNDPIDGIIGFAGDKDWFIFSTTGQQTNVQITLTNVAANYNLKLFQYTGELLLTSMNEGTDNEVITHNTAIATTYKVRVWGWDSAFVAGACYSLVVNTSATPFIPQEMVMYDSDFSIYPNPATSDVTIESSDIDEFAQAVIVDMTGRILMQQCAQPGDFAITMNVSDLRAGIYFVQLISDGEMVLTQKLLKQ